MRVVSTFHQPSSVCCSEKCMLTPNNYYLVVGKPNRLEVYSLKPDGLFYECGIEIWGLVVTIKPVYVQESQAHKIILLTDHPHPKLILLSYSSEDDIPSLKEDFVVDLQEPGAQPSEFLTDVVVDRSAAAAVVVCYARKLKVVLLEYGTCSESFDVSLPEQNILSITFLPTPSNTFTLGILHLDSEQRLQLTSRDLDLHEHELSPPPSTYFPNSALSPLFVPIRENLPILIPVHEPEPFGGVIVLGGKEIYFFEAQQKKQKTNNRDAESNLAKGKASLMMLPGQQKHSKRRKHKASVMWPWDEISAWCQVDLSKYLLGDKSGRLALLELRAGLGFTLLPLGEANPAASLTYLSSQVVYLGSFLSEPQLLRIHPIPFKKLEFPTLPLSPDLETSTPSELDAHRHKEKYHGSGKVVSTSGSYIELLEAYSNLAPISDAVLFDSDNSGQSQILICSGGGHAGSLKIVSNGASFFESSIIPIADATSLFSIRASYFSSFHTYVVVSTPRETHVFKPESNSISHVDAAMVTGVATNVSTLAISNIARRVPRIANKSTSTYTDSSFAVQVTINEVLLIDVDQALGVPVLVGEPWNPRNVEAWQEKQIVAADINASQITLALTGGILVLLNLDANDRFHLVAYKDFGCDISVVSCLPQNPSSFYSTIFIIGFWESNTVHVLSLSDPRSPFKLVCTSTPLPALPHSILLHNFGSSHDADHPDYRPHLLIGLTDGTLISYIYDEFNRALKARMTTSLGSAPVHLTAFNVNETRSVFACGSRAEVLYWDMQRLQHSQVLLKDATWATHLNTANTPSSLALCTRDTIVIGRVCNLNQVHIRSIPCGADVPQKILAMSKYKAFAVAYTRECIDGGAKATSKLKLLDQTSFRCLAEFFCEAGEEISALELLSIPDDATYLCVGTVYNLDLELEPSKGRLVFLKIHTSCNTSSSQMQLSQVVVIPTQGCVYALTTLGQMLAIAANSSVVLFKISELDALGQGLHVEKTASWNHNYVVTSLVSNGNTLIVGDVINSISVLEVSSTGLTIKARDYTPLWPYRIQSLDNNNVVGGNVDRTLFTFRSQTTDNRMTLERDGSYNLHELITKLIPGTLSRTLSQDEDVALTPKVVFFTSTGRIGIISDLNPTLALNMTALQNNMEKIIYGPGNTKHDMLRATNARYESQLSIGFLDGQFLEQFLNLGPDMRRRVLEGSNEAEKLKLSEAQIENILEQFQRIH